MVEVLQETPTETKDIFSHVNPEAVHRVFNRAVDQFTQYLSDPEQFKVIALATKMHHLHNIFSTHWQYLPDGSKILEQLSKAAFTRSQETEHEEAQTYFGAFQEYYYGLNNPDPNLMQSE